MADQKTINELIARGNAAMGRTNKPAAIGGLAIEMTRLDRACCDWFLSPAAAGKTISEAPDFAAYKAAAQQFDEARYEAIRAMLKPAIPRVKARHEHID